MNSDAQESRYEKLEPPNHKSRQNTNLLEDATKIERMVLDSLSVAEQDGEWSIKRHLVVNERLRHLDKRISALEKIGEIVTRFKWAILAILFPIFLVVLKWVLDQLK